MIIVNEDKIHRKKDLVNFTKYDNKRKTFIAYLYNGLSIVEIIILLEGGSLFTQTLIIYPQTRKTLYPRQRLGHCTRLFENRSSAIEYWEQELKNEFLQIESTYKKQLNELHTQN
jgi:hypothetical protein